MIGVGTVVSSKYRLVRLLGDGGMGSVYEAVHEVLGTRTAVKVLHADLARRSGLIDRFLREARVSAQIRSPHVVQVIDVDRTAEGTAYIVMELLEGEALSSVLERERRLSLDRAVDYTRQILEALEAAHALGVTHRDLKPENVFVTFVGGGGKPILKLIDFGIAKIRMSEPGARSLTVAGIVMGTAEYMAPEQAQSADQADARSDIYAVGVMLYEMIAGMRPVAGTDARVIAAKVERGEVMPLVHAAPDVPRELAGLVHRAMAARPELRFASAAEMRLALEGVPVTAEAKPRVPTAQLPAGTVVQPSAPPPAGAALGAVTGLTAGTVLGAPMAAVFSAQEVALPAHAVAGGTAAPYLPPMPPVDMRHAEPVRHTGRRRGLGLWLLLAAPLLLGGAVVVAFVLQGADARPMPPLITGPTTPAPTGTSAPTSAAAQPTAVEPVAPLTPVVTAPVVRPTTPAARPSVSATGSAAPAPPPTLGVPTITLPSGFPTNFPLPMPSAMPSGFPTTFPTVFPPFPPPAQPPPSPVST